MSRDSESGVATTGQRSGDSAALNAASREAWTLTFRSRRNSPSQLVEPGATAPTAFGAPTGSTSWQSKRSLDSFLAVAKKEEAKPRARDNRSSDFASPCNPTP